MTRGDLVDDLAALVAAVPAQAATTVVFHSAVLAYVDDAKRAAFAALAGQLGVHWLSNDGSSVLPATRTVSDDGGFVLVENGHRLLAYTDPHGTWIRHITLPDKF